jgi:hypothetical protein
MAVGLQKTVYSMIDRPTLYLRKQFGDNQRSATLLQNLTALHLIALVMFSEQ